MLVRGLQVGGRKMQNDTEFCLLGISVLPTQASETIYTRHKVSVEMGPGG